MADDEERVLYEQGESSHGNRLGELYTAIRRRYQAQANAEIEAAVDGILDAQPPRVVVLDNGEGGPLSLPADEPLCDHLFCNVPCAFTRARGALASPIACGMVGHAPDCECATL